MKKGFFRNKKLWIAVLVLSALLIWLLWGNTALMIHSIRISSDRLPASFDGFTIVQISDLHNTEFGAGNEKLLRMIEDASPDIIVLTGDLIDSNRTDLKVALDFAGSAAKLAPTFFVTGNHESYIEEYGQLKNGLNEAGVRTLRNESVLLRKGEDAIELIGLDDPAFLLRGNLFGEVSAMMDTKIKGLLLKDNPFTILLSHRPELFEVYAENRIDVTLSGHAHGGQIRLPFVGGLIAPNQGLFPKYDAGLFTEGASHMVVSRGLGNSVLPLRVNNRPEIVVVTLRRDIV